MPMLWDLWDVAMRRESHSYDLHFDALKGKTIPVATTPVTTIEGVDSFESAYEVLVAPPSDARLVKRSTTAHTITMCAQQLAIEHGYDEFTLDQLAQAAGVSRRTLFNYFPSKLDAVLGTLPRVPHEDAEAFLQGRPTGTLMHDLSLLVLKLLEHKQVSKQEWRLSRECFERNPKLLVSAMGKFRETCAAAQQLIAKREGVDPQSPRACVSISLLCGLFDVSINQFVEDDQTRPLGDIYMDNLNLAGQLLRGSAG